MTIKSRMSFEGPNNPRSSQIVTNQIQLTALAMYKERTPCSKTPSLDHDCGLDHHMNIPAQSHLVDHSSIVDFSAAPSHRFLSST